MTEILKQLPKFKILMFDSCYMGNLESLSSLYKYSDYILCTSSSHEGSSFLLLYPIFQKIKWKSTRSWINNVVNLYIENLKQQRKKGYSVGFTGYQTKYIRSNLVFTHFVFERKGITLSKK